MSFEVATEHVCYVHCNFCNTVLAVSVPCSNLLNIVTVRCGHCANLLSVNMGGALQQTLPLQTPQNMQNNNMGPQEYGLGCGSSSSSSSSKANMMAMLSSEPEIDHHPIHPIRPPEKRQRVPSAYNRFIKEEIQRIKANNPDISHREAFSAAAKNWAHFPRIHFGLTLDANKQMNEVIGAAEGAQKTQGLLTKSCN